MANHSHSPDEWSDHDLWVVTRAGTAGRLRTTTEWLPDAERIVGHFVETEHGRSVIYNDGHLIEIAVFEDSELEIATANDYRILYDEIGLGRYGRGKLISAGELIRERASLRSYSLAAVQALLDRAAGTNPRPCMLHHVQLAMPERAEATARQFYAGLLGFVEVEKPPVLVDRGGCWFRGPAIEIHLAVESPFSPATKAHPGIVTGALDALEFLRPV